MQFVYVCMYKYVQVSATVQILKMEQYNIRNNVIYLDFHCPPNITLVSRQIVLLLFVDFDTFPKRFWPMFIHNNMQMN